MGSVVPDSAASCYNTTGTDTVRTLAKHPLGGAGTATSNSVLSSQGHSKNTQWTLDSSCLCLVFATWTESFATHKPWTLLGRERGVWKNVLGFLFLQAVVAHVMIFTHKIKRSFPVYKAGHMDHEFISMKHVFTNSHRAIPTEGLS